MARQEAAEAARAKRPQNLPKNRTRTNVRPPKRRSRAWADTLVADGKIPPAMASGMAEFSESLAGLDVIEFAEGEGGQKKKQSPAEWFKGFVGQLEESPLFAEFATKDRAAAAKDSGSGWNSEMDDRV